jgi:hypothetical protein
MYKIQRGNQWESVTGKGVILGEVGEQLRIIEEDGTERFLSLKGVDGYMTDGPDPRQTKAAWTPPPQTDPIP